VDLPPSRRSCGRDAASLLHPLAARDETAVPCNAIHPFREPKYGGKTFGWSEEFEPPAIQGSAKAARRTNASAG